MERKTETDQPLRGKRILVADDEFLILVGIEDALQDAGADVISAATLPEALKHAREDALSAALLDVRLGRQTTEAVADTLFERAVPFVFYTGQALPDEMRGKHSRAEVLVKPSKQAVFVDAMVRATNK